MGKYILKRILQAVLYLFIIVSVLFLLLGLAPREVLFAKPVIYLYPKEVTDVTVQLDYDGQLTCTYPAYENGWTVTAAPDGTLTDANGQTYN